MKSQKSKRVVSAIIIIIMTALMITMYVPVAHAEDYTNTEFDYDWNNPCCDGGRCCIDNDCSCPMCWGRTNPGDPCPDCGGDTCPDCGNCPECGTSPCPSCRQDNDPDKCDNCGGPLCNACWGCPDCGNNQNPSCPFCGAGEPLFTIGNTDVYLFAPAGIPSWSLFNILAATLGLAAFIWLITKAILQKKKEEEENRHTFTLQAVDEADNDSLISTIANKERINTRRRLWALTATFICTITNIVLTIATQDFRGIVALFDSWSILQGILLIGSITLSMLTFRGYED